MTPALTTAGHPIHTGESHTHRRCRGSRALVEKNLPRIRGRVRQGNVGHIGNSQRNRINK